MFFCYFQTKFEHLLPKSSKKRLQIAIETKNTSFQPGTQRKAKHDWLMLFLGELSEQWQCKCGPVNYCQLESLKKSGGRIVLTTNTVSVFGETKHDAMQNAVSSLYGPGATTLSGMGCTTRHGSQKTLFSA